MSMVTADPAAAPGETGTAGAAGETGAGRAAGAGPAGRRWLARGDDRGRLTAAATATLLAVDAWFDVTTAAPGSQRLIALALALCPELPVAALCLTLALRGHPVRGG